MKTKLPDSDTNSCADTCAGVSQIESLNQDCLCLTIDPGALQAQLDAVLQALGVPSTLAQTHPNLFSALPVFVSRAHLDRVAEVVTTIEAVANMPGYRSAVLQWAPSIAEFDPGSPGGLLGFDFHLGADGPRLIEINTNPGGAVLNAILARSQRLCMPDLTIPPVDAEAVESALVDILITEWTLQRGNDPLTSIAIVDEAPGQQYLYPEFVLLRELCRSRGYRTQICAPEELVLRDGQLWFNGQSVDFVYNRLTDFPLEDPGSRMLREAYLAGDVVVSPHPRAHAIYADKRNLGLLCDARFLRGIGLGQASSDLLAQAVPETRLLTPENRDALWASRGHWFFKPAAGYGSKASYRGDKLTRGVWDAMSAGTYVAQQIVAPSERQTRGTQRPLKVDLRCYAYRGEVLLYAARMYQGQTTNFRTPGGGFAPVLTRG
ncbi:hypothetical protein BH11PSE14_BH11PSE14_01510 [soil metagenome]